MPRFATILIDLDGTLVDAFTTIHRGYIHTLPLFGRPAPSMEEVRRAVGGGIENAMAHFLPKESIAEAIRIHIAYADQILLEDVKLMPGAFELLRSLHGQGVKLAVLTNKPAHAARRICGHFGVTPLLQGVFGAGDTAWLKPNPEFSRHALKQIGADARTTMLLGDSPFDVETGRKGGFPCWCVTTGTHDEAQLRAAGAEMVFPDLNAVAAEIG